MKIALLLLVALLLGLVGCGGPQGAISGQAEVHVATQAARFELYAAEDDRCGGLHPADREAHRPVVLIEIQPFFLKGFEIPEEALIAVIDRLGYDLYLYDEGSAKLRRHADALIDSNYLMIHRDRIAEFGDILEDVLT